MNILIPFILVLFSFRFVLSLTNRESKRYRDREQAFCFFAYVFFVILAALRSSAVGPDTPEYMDDYFTMAEMTFSDILYKYDDALGFYGLSKLFSMAGAPLWVWFGFVELVYISAIARFIESNSTDKLYSIVFFILLGLFKFSLAGMKQTLAMGLILHAFLEYRDKRYITTLLLCIWAYLSHPTVLVFIPAFVLYTLRKKKIFGVVVLVFVLVILFGSLPAITSIISNLGMEHFEMYLDEKGAYSAWALVFYILLICMALPFIKTYSHHVQYDGEHSFELGCLIIACSLQYLSFMSPSLFRLALYYTPIFLTYLPNSFVVKKTSVSSMMKIVTMIGAIIFFWYSNRYFVYSFV